MVRNRVPFANDINGKGRAVVAGSNKRSRERKRVFVRLSGSGVRSKKGERNDRSARENASASASECVGVRVTLAAKF